jgi:hypothetical protein
MKSAFIKFVMAQLLPFFNYQQKEVKISIVTCGASKLVTVLSFVSNSKSLCNILMLECLVLIAEYTSLSMCVWHLILWETVSGKVH